MGSAHCAMIQTLYSNLQAYVCVYVIRVAKAWRLKRASHR
jgi:hypothetical protein